jgi:hypothetical protein
MDEVINRLGDITGSVIWRQRPLTPIIQPMTNWPIFICYRQSDGTLAAERIYSLLQHQSVPIEMETSDGRESPRLDVYFDQAAPGVGDWTSVHEPYLKRARAIIIICTPGAKLNEGSEDWVHREIDWWLEQREMSPILIDPLGEGTRYVPEGISSRWPNAQRIKLIEKDWDGLNTTEKSNLEKRVREQILGAIVPSGEGFYRQELEQEKARANRLRRIRRGAIAIATAFVFLSVIAVWIYNLKMVADEAAMEAVAARQSAESAATEAIEARNQAVAAQQLVQLRVIENQAARARTEAELMSILQQFKKYEAYGNVMKEWEADFNTLSDTLGKSVQGSLPACNLVGRFSIYERQLVTGYLDNMPDTQAFYAYLAVVPGSSTREGDWAPSVLDLFFASRDQVSPDRDIDRNKVKQLMRDVPVDNQWGLLIGLGTPHLITYKDRNFRISRKGMNMNDDGDIISLFEICQEEQFELNR